jgi:hypothetical protein
MSNFLNDNEMFIAFQLVNYAIVAYAIAIKATPLAGHRFVLNCLRIMSQP